MNVAGGPWTTSLGRTGAALSCWRRDAALVMLRGSVVQVAWTVRRDAGRDDCQGRLRPSARPHRPFPCARARFRVGKLLKLAAGRRPAGAGRHRHQQSVRRAGNFRKIRQGRRSADRRLPAHRRFRRRRAVSHARRGAGSSTRRAAIIVLLAQDERGYLNLMHLVSQAWLEVEAGRHAACHAGAACARRARA